MEIHQDPDVIRYLAPASAPNDITVAWRNVAMMIGHWHLRGYGPWIVTDKSGGEILGRVGLWNPEGWPGVELGWMIRRSAWGRGFATEAARAALTWAWAHLDTNHIISMIHTENILSIRVAEKTGQRLERREVVDGANKCVYGIHRDASAGAAYQGREADGVGIL